MTLDESIWVATAAYALHILEEYVLDWASWARFILKLPVGLNDFYLTNAVVMVLGAVAAEIAPEMPALALCFPALILLNVIFLHIGPFVGLKGRFSPGAFTGVGLLLPVAALCYRAAYRSGVLTAETLVLSVAGGALLLAAPLAFLKLRNLPYFVQPQRSR